MGISPTLIQGRASPGRPVSRRPVFCAIAPVKAPRSCPKSSLSSSPVGIAAQLSFTNVRSLRRLRFMDRAAQSILFPCRFHREAIPSSRWEPPFPTRFKTWRRAELCPTIPSKIHLATDFIFQIQFFPVRALSFNFSDFTIGQRILNSDCHLPQLLAAGNQRLPG